MSCYGLLIERLKKRRVGLRMKHSARMRIERDGGWTSSDRVRPLDNRLPYPLMAEVQSTKNTQCKYSGLSDV